MSELIEYNPLDDPAPDDKDGLISRHRCRWFHDTLRLLQARGEPDLYTHLEIQFVNAYWGEKLDLPYSQAEFEARFRDSLARNAAYAGVDELIRPILTSDPLPLMERWLIVILSYTYARDKAKVKNWLRQGRAAGAPEYFVETLVERYNAEWGEGGFIRPERLGGDLVPTLGSQRPHS